MYKSERIDETGRRIYTNIEDKDFASTTTILSAYEDKTGLVEWAEKVGQEEAERIRVATSERGKLSHALVESFFVTLGDCEKYKNNPYAKTAVEGFYSRVEPYMQEEVLFSEHIPGARMAGRFDQAVYVPPETFTLAADGMSTELEYVQEGYIITDLKTKDKQPRLDKVEYLIKNLLQVSSYASMLENTYKIKVTGAVVVYSVVLKTKQVCRKLYINKDNINFYWRHMKRLIEDYNGIRPVRDGYWYDIVKQATCYYDVESETFSNHCPREIF
jgi:hypothetical protein